MHQFLTAQLPLTALVPAARWYQAGNVVDAPTKPFVVLRWLAPVPGDARGSFAHQLRVDVHDNRGSYARIDAFNALVQPYLKAVRDLVGADGRIGQCDFLGLGGDQEDETYKTNYSFTSWQVMGVRL